LGDLSLIRRFLVLFTFIQIIWKIDLVLMVENGWRASNDNGSSYHLTCTKLHFISIFNASGFPFPDCKQLTEPKKHD
jgi:hypothetical protein